MSALDLDQLVALADLDQLLADLDQSVALADLDQLLADLNQLVVVPQLVVQPALDLNLPLLNIPHPH